MHLIRSPVARASHWLLVPALLLVSSAAWFQAAGKAAQPDQILRPFTQFTLDNGLNVLVREDHKLPIVSVAVTYNVGSRNDPPGRSGMAHLFEHLLFYGSQHSPGNYLVTMQNLGINANGGTDIDATIVHETAPVSQLDAVLWLESDRMGYLTLTQKTLTEQIETVVNEINMNRDEPGGEVRHYIAAGVFPANHPYHEEAVGHPEELRTVTLDEVLRFYKTYYVPSNAVIALAGDITPSEALGKVKRYFGGLPTGPRPGRMAAWIPELSHDKRERIFDTSSPEIFLNWPMPGFGSIDDVHLRLAGSILMDGASSRVRRRLTAAGFNQADLSWAVNGRDMVSIFQVWTKAASPAEFRAIERIIRDEIEALATTEPTTEELERAKRSRFLELRRLMQKTSDNDGQAGMLAGVWSLGDGDAGLLDDNMQQMRAARPADVSAATGRWLNRAAYILDVEPTVHYKPTSPDVDRTRIPPPTAFEPADFPETHVATLLNGLKVHHAQWQGGPVVVASLIVRGGASADPKEKAGIARLTASLMTAGADKMSAEQFADAMARLDATLEATTDLDAITLTLVAPREQMKEALDLLRAVASTPTFPAAAVEREKKKQLQELQGLRNESWRLSRATVRRLAYGPNARYAVQEDGLGTTSGVSRITRADLVDYHRSRFHPANSEIVIVGDIGQDEAEAALIGTLGHWTSSGLRASDISMPHQANGPSLPGQVAAPGLYLVDQPGMEQADLTAAMLIDAPISPAHSTNAVMMRILGDITSGRLNRDLRDSKQWAYWARGYIEGGRAGQVLLFRTQVQDQRAAEAIAAMKGQLENVKGSKPISPDEMQRAKDALTLSLPVEWETDEGIAKAMATAVRHGLPEGAIEKYVTDVRAVTKEQVEQAARRILRPDAMVWLVIADASEVEPQLRKAGISYRVLTPE